MAGEKIAVNPDNGHVFVQIDGGWEEFPDRQSAQAAITGGLQQQAPKSKGPLSGLPGPVKLAGATALPVLGGIAGSFLSPVLGTAAGSAAGTALSQQLGLEEKSLLGVGASGLLAGAGKPLSYLAGKIPKILPAMSAVRLDEAARQAPDFVRQFTGQQAGALWDSFRSLGNFQLNGLPATQAALNKIGPEVASIIKGVPGVARIRALIKGVDQGMRTGKLMDVKALDNNIKTIGKAIGKMEREGGAELGAFKHVLAGMYDDLGRAPTLSVSGATANQVEAIALRKAAVEASRREFALEELTETVASNIKIVSSQGDLLNIHAGSILNRIKALTNPASKSYDKNFVLGLKKELPEIEKWFTEVNKIPSIKGSGGTLVLQGLFAGAGSALGGVPGAAMGAVIGAQIPEHVIASLLSPAGRKIMLESLKAGEKLGRSVITPQVLNLTSQLGRSYISQPQQESEDGLND